MTGEAHLQALMRAIGPQLELLEVTEFAAEHVWTLVVDDETILFADHDAERGLLVLSGQVAQPPESERLRLYDLLLRYNGQARTTGGVRMALDGAAGMVVQSFDLRLDNLDLPRLQAVITGFLATLRAWRTIITRGAIGNEERFLPTAMHIIHG